MMIGPSGVSWNYATIMIGRRHVINGLWGLGMQERGGVFSARLQNTWDIARKQPSLRNTEEVTTSWPRRIRLSIFLLSPSLLLSKAAMPVPQSTQVRLEREVILDQ